MLRPYFHSCLAGESPSGFHQKESLNKQLCVFPASPQLYLGAFKVILLRNIADLQGLNREQVLMEMVPKMEKGMQRHDAVPGEEIRGFGAETLSFPKVSFSPPWQGVGTR